MIPSIEKSNSALEINFNHQPFSLPSLIIPISISPSICRAAEIAKSCTNSLAAIAWGNLPPRNPLIMRASKQNSRTRPQNLPSRLVLEPVSLRRDLSMLISSRKAWRRLRSSPVAGPEAGPPKPRHVPSQGQGSPCFLFLWPFPAFSIFEKAPGRCSAGEIGSGGLSGIFSCLLPVCVQRVKPVPRDFPDASPAIACGMIYKSFAMDRRCDAGSEQTSLFWQYVSVRLNILRSGHLHSGCNGKCSCRDIDSKKDVTSENKSKLFSLLASLSPRLKGQYQTQNNK